MMKEIIYCALFYLIVISLVFCDELERKEANRSKRTIGLFLDSLANFLNVQDVENTTPITFTTSAPGYRRKSPPPKVQKWPPLDLEITPWVLQAVPPTTATPSPSSHPVTSPVYLTTEQPNIHAQVVIIPLSETDNHLHPKHEIKTGHGSYLKTENINPKPIKFVSPHNHGSRPTNNRFVQPNFQYQPITPQTEIYYWQKLFPNQRLGKHINFYQPRLPPQQQQELDKPHLLPQQYHQLVNLLSKTNQQNHTASVIRDQPSKRNHLLQKDAEALIKIGYLYGRTINEKLSNLGGNDFNREKQEDKYRSFIDAEPKFISNYNSTAKDNDLSQFYLLERSKRLKNLNNIMKFSTSKNKNLFNENDDDKNDDDKTDVEIVKSVEPMSYDIDYKDPFNDGDDKESKFDGSYSDENSYSGPTFEMVKSFELPNSDSSNGNTNFEFHMDPDETPTQFEGDVRNDGFNFSEIKKNNIHPFRNKKVSFIPPSERERYELKNSANSERRLNRYLTSDKIYDDVYNVNKPINPYYKNEYFNDKVELAPKFDILNHNSKYESSQESKITPPGNFPNLIHRPLRPKASKNKSFQDIYSSNKLPKKNKNFEVGENISAEDLDYRIHTEGANFDYPNNSRDLQQQSEKINNQVSSHPARRGRVRYNQLTRTYGKNQEFGDDFISKSSSPKLPPLPEYSNDNLNNNFNADINPYSYTVDPSKFNSGNNFYDNLSKEKQYNQKEYSTKKLTNLGRKSNEGIKNSYDYTLQNPEAQLHIFIPEEQSLQSPEKQEKSQEALYQNDAPDYYQEYQEYQLPDVNKLQVDDTVKTLRTTGTGSPRLPDNLHEQLVENQGAGIRRNLISPPSFDQQTDMTEHRAKCLPQPFVKLKYACNNTAQHKITNQS